MSSDSHCSISSSVPFLARLSLPLPESENARTGKLYLCDFYRSPYPLSHSKPPLLPQFPFFMRAGWAPLRSPCNTRSEKREAGTAGQCVFPSEDCCTLRPHERPLVPPQLCTGGKSDVLDTFPNVFDIDFQLKKTVTCVNAYSFLPHLLPHSDASPGGEAAALTE
jgi:hypothetical protein